MKTYTIDFTTQLDLNTLNPSYVPTDIVVRDYQLTGIYTKAIHVHESVNHGEFYSMSKTLTEQEAQQIDSSIKAVYVLSAGKLVRIPDTHMRAKLNSNTLTVEFLYDGQVEDQLFIQQPNSFEKIACTFQTNTFTHQLIVESESEFDGSCKVGNTVVQLSNGVNILNQYGTLDVSINLSTQGKVQVVPVQSGANVVFEQVKQPAGRLIQCTQDFTQKSGSQSQQVSSSNPSLNTLVFHTFDAYCSPNSAQPILTFQIEDTSHLVQYRLQQDITATVHIKPRGTGIMPVLSSQRIYLKG